MVGKIAPPMQKNFIKQQTQEPVGGVNCQEMRLNMRVTPPRQG